MVEPIKSTVATGGSLIGLTITVISCESESSLSVVVIVNVSLPLKFSDAVNTISLPSSVAVISPPPEILNVKSSPSTSLADKLVLPDPSSSNDTSETLARTGASFTGVTDNSKDCVSVSSPSPVSYTHLTLPTNREV